MNFAYFSTDAVHTFTDFGKNLKNFGARVIYLYYMQDIQYRSLPKNRYTKTCIFNLEKESIFFFTDFLKYFCCSPFRYLKQNFKNFNILKITRKNLICYRSCKVCLRCIFAILFEIIEERV